MRYCFTLALWVLFSVAVHGQDSVSIRHKPKHAVKWSPMHLWGFYPSMQLAYEVGISERIGIQVDAGYVLNFGGNLDEDYQNKRGVKLKTELRYYFESLPKSSDGFYMSVEPYWNQVKFDRSLTSEECFDPACQTRFLRYNTFGVRYKELGLSTKGGYLIFFDSNILMDVTVGWSLRSIDYQYPEGMENTLMNTLNFFEPNEEDRIVLSPTIGLRVGYRFR